MKCFCKNGYIAIIGKIVTTTVVILTVSGAAAAFGTGLDSSNSKTAASVEFGKFIYTFSKGEKPSGNEADDDKFYVPIIVTDAQGYKLTPQEIYEKKAAI